MQAGNESVDLRTIRALLRLYSMFPNKANTDNIALALAKVLVLHPEPEFLQLLYLVPEKMYTPTILALIEVDRLLQCADWIKLWKRVEQGDVAGVIAKVGGFSASVREYIFGAVNRTYSRIERSALASSLNVNESAAESFAVQRGASVEGADIVLPSLQDNSDKKRVEKADPIVLKQGEVSSILNLLSR